MARSARTNVSVVYTPSLNQSITTKGGRITKVTTWTTGVSGSTSTVECSSARVSVERVRKP